MPTTKVQKNEHGISQIMKAPSPSKSQSQTASISPQERRLRPIAPAPIIFSQSSNELLNTLLAQQQQQLLLEQQQQQQQSEMNEGSESISNKDIPLTTISETVTVDTNGSMIKTKVESTSATSQKPKNHRKKHQYQLYLMIKKLESIQKTFGMIEFSLQIFLFSYLYSF